MAAWLLKSIPVGRQDCDTSKSCDGVSEGTTEHVIETEPDQSHVTIDEANENLDLKSQQQHVPLWEA